MGFLDDYSSSSLGVYLRVLGLHSLSYPSHINLWSRTVVRDTDNYNNTKIKRLLGVSLIRPDTNSTVILQPGN